MDNETKLRFDQMDEQFSKLNIRYDRLEEMTSNLIQIVGKTNLKVDTLSSRVDDSSSIVELK